MHILLADDYVPVMGLVVGALDYDPDLQFDTATSGRELLRKFTGDRFDLIVLNLRLRETDGIECLSVIRRLNPGQKLLVLTEQIDHKAAADLRSIGIRSGSVMLRTDDRGTLSQRIGAALRAET